MPLSSCFGSDDDDDDDPQIEGDIIGGENSQYKVGQSHKAGLPLNDTTFQTPV